MADTIQTQAQLAVLLADNSSGAISPQDARNLMVSIMGVYAQLYAHDGVSTQVVGTSAADITGWSAVQAEDGIDADHSVDSITIGAGHDGLYLALTQFTFSGTLNTTFEFHLAVDGVETPGGGCKRKLGTGGDVGSCSFPCLIALVSGEEVTVQVEADGAGKDFDLVHGQLVLVRLA